MDQVEVHLNQHQYYRDLPYVNILIYICNMSLFTLLIGPSAIMLYCNMSISHVEVSGHTHIICTLLMNESSLTISVVYDINLTY